MTLGRRSALKVIHPLLALCLALGAAAFTPSTVARASGPGPGPCATITPAEMAAWGWGPAGGADAHLSRTQGAVGTALSVTGAGWPAGATIMVDAYAKYGGHIDGPIVPLGQGIASSTGGISIGAFRAPRLDVCASMNGNQDTGQTIFLAHTPDGRIRAPMSFTYLTYLRGPQLTTNLTGESIAPGAPLTITGSRWEPGERVTVTPMFAPWVPNTQPQPAVQPIAGAAASAIADNQGAFSLTLPALHEPPTTQISFDAQGTGSRYGNVDVGASWQSITLLNVYFWKAVMLPAVYPSIHLDTGQAAPGAAVTVTGDHWEPNQHGIVEYCREQHYNYLHALHCDQSLDQRLGVFQADAAGHFVAHVRLPAYAAPGAITIQALDPTAPFGLTVYAQAQPLTIARTFDQTHPQLARLLAWAPIVGGALLVLLVLLGALAMWRVMRWRGRSGATPTRPE